MRKNGPSQDTPVRVQLLERLRSAITEGMYQPGDHLVERELCEQLGVSRTSLREALRQVEAEGLIEFFPNRGAVVRDISTVELLDLWELRCLVEGLIARRFATLGTEADILRLEQAIAAVDNALKSQDRAAIKHSKLELWEAFAAGGHHHACGKLILQLNARLGFLWSSSLMMPGRPAESIAEFYSLLNAIRSRNPAVAEAAIVLHNEHAKFVALRGLSAFEAARHGGNGSATKKTKAGKMAEAAASVKAAGKTPARKAAATPAKAVGKSAVKAAPKTAAKAATKTAAKAAPKAASKATASKRTPVKTARRSAAG